MAKNKTSKFGVADGFFGDERAETAAPVIPSGVSEEKRERQTENTLPHAEENTEKENKFLERITEEGLEEMMKRYRKEQSEKPRGLYDTRGRKGEKLRKMNFNFTDLNYDYLKYESRRRGLTMTEFINGIIEEYRTSPEGYID